MIVVDSQQSPPQLVNYLVPNISVILTSVDAFHRVTNYKSSFRVIDRIKKFLILAHFFLSLHLLMEFGDATWPHIFH